MNKKEEIGNFIKNFKNRSGERNRKYIEEFFLNGGCYWFAHILKSQFPFGKILYDLTNNHFLFYGDNIVNVKEAGIFDIRGDVTDTYLPWILNGTVIEWNMYDDLPHRERIWRDCIAFLKEDNE